MSFDVLRAGDLPRSERGLSIARTIDQVGRRNLGVVTTRGLAAAGVSEGARDAAVQRGQLLVLQRGVYRPSGAILSAEGELLAACSAAGPRAVASHRAALWLWDLGDFPDRPELTVPYGCGPAVRGAVLHRTKALDSRHVTVRRGVPCVTPARTLLDVGAVLRPWQVGNAVELALVRRLVSVAGLREVLVQAGGRGRRGAGVLRTYLDERALGDVRAESVLEPIMARLCRDAGVGLVLFQHELVLDGRRLRPDFLIPEAMLVIEVDGLAVHAGRDALDHDLERQNLFTRHGYLVLRYTSTHLKRPAQVAREILDVARQRRRDLAPDEL